MEIKEGRVTLDQKRKAYEQGLIDFIYNQLNSYNFNFKPDSSKNETRVIQFTNNGKKKFLLNTFCRAWFELDDFDFSSDLEVFQKFTKDCATEYIENTEYPIAGRKAIPVEYKWVDSFIYEPGDEEEDDLGPNGEHNLYKSDPESVYKALYWMRAVLIEVEDEN